jgi:hypothetical protein
MSVATIEKPPLEAFAEQLAEKKAEQTEKLDGLDEPAGATMALAEAQGAGRDHTLHLNVVR